MDKAGWHTADELRVPENLSLGSCRPTHLSSTRSSGCGCIYATIACPTASFRRPRGSLTAVARPGTGCSLKPVASVPYAPIRGSNRSAANQAGIRPSPYPCRSKTYAPERSATTVAAVSAPLPEPPLIAAAIFPATAVAAAFTRSLARWA